MSLEGQKSNWGHSDQTHAAPDASSDQLGASPNDAATRVSDLRRMTLSSIQPTAPAKFWQLRSKQLRALVWSSLSSISQRAR
jgi:hypothetical protein